MMTKANNTLQSFVTTDCRNCFRDNRGDISCDQPQSAGDESGSHILHYAITLHLIVALLCSHLNWRCCCNSNGYHTDHCSSDSDIIVIL